MRKLAIVASVLAVVGLTIVAAAALANRGHGQGGNNFRANLNGYNEVVGGRRRLDGIRVDDRPRPVHVADLQRPHPLHARLLRSFGR